MSNSTISFLLGLFSYLSDSIFLGAKILVPLMLIVKILKPGLKSPDQKILTTTINTLILTGGILFLGAISINLLATLRTGSSDEFNFMLSMVTGSQWYKFMIPFICFGILPNVFWIKKMRVSFYIALYMVILWYAAFFLLDYLSGSERGFAMSMESESGIRIKEYAGKFLLFVALAAVSYKSLKGKKNTSNIHEL